MNIVNRAQGRKSYVALENKEVQTNLPIKKKRGHKPQSRKSKKNRLASQGTLEWLDEANGGEMPQTNLHPNLAASMSQSSRGSIKADKVHEPLRVALDAYNDCVTPLIEIPRKLQEYPNP